MASLTTQSIGTRYREDRTPEQSLGCSGCSGVGQWRVVPVRPGFSLPRQTMVRITRHRSGGHAPVSRPRRVRAEMWSPPTVTRQPGAVVSGAHSVMRGTGRPGVVWWADEPEEGYRYPGDPRIAWRRAVVPATPGAAPRAVQVAASGLQGCGCVGLGQGDCPPCPETSPFAWAGLVVAADVGISLATGRRPSWKWTLAKAAAVYLWRRSRG